MPPPLLTILAEAVLLPSPQSMVLPLKSEAGAAELRQFFYGIT